MGDRALNSVVGTDSIMRLARALRDVLENC